MTATKCCGYLDTIEPTKVCSWSASDTIRNFTEINFITKCWLYGKDTIKTKIIYISKGQLKNAMSSCTVISIDLFHNYYQQNIAFWSLIKCWNSMKLSEIAVILLSIWHQNQDRAKLNIVMPQYLCFSYTQKDSSNEFQDLPAVLDFQEYSRYHRDSSSLVQRHAFKFTDRSHLQQFS